MNTRITTPDTMTINTYPWPIHTGDPKPAWIAEAKAKGFIFVARILDRLHLALQCSICGHLNKVRLFTLMNARPLCSHCVEQAWKRDATAAKLTYLCRDPAHRHYGIYRMTCGHQIRRQFALIRRVASGAIGLRCETCHRAAEVAEAAAQGWELLGPDLNGDPYYRLYRHTDCGHEQRISRGNLQTQRFSCGGCGLDWPAAPSFIYAMSFTTAAGRELVKAGFSRNPSSRLHHQLVVDPDMPCAILKVVAVPTGQEAIRLEKALHRKLKRAHPDMLIDPTIYRDQIRVTSEIYDGALTPVLLAHLDEIETEIGRTAALS